MVPDFDSLKKEEKKLILDNIVQVINESVYEIAYVLSPIFLQVADDLREFAKAVYYPGMGGRGIKRRSHPTDGGEDEE